MATQRAGEVAAGLAFLYGACYGIHVDKLPAVLVYGVLALLMLVPISWFKRLASS